MERQGNSDDEQRYLLERTPPEWVESLKFRLVYDGPLPSEQRGGIEAKHLIRKQLHPQLRHLWMTHPILGPYVNPEAPKRGGVEKVADEYARHGYRFVPLLRVANLMACRLDIMVLLRDEPHRVFAGGERGDLDNRIKTLIDGLRMPSQKSELGGQPPSPDEDPFYCLLEDDKLIYEFNVKADRLLAPPRPDQAARDVVAIIGVHVTTGERFEMSVYSHGFGLKGE